MPEVRRRSVSKETAVTRRRDRVEDPEPVEDDELEDIDATEQPARTRKAKPKTRVVERHNYEDDVEDGDDAEEEKPVRRAPATRTSKTRSGLPPGIHVGLAGAEEVRKSAGGGPSRLTLTTEPSLFKVLDLPPESPFVSYRQHWIAQGGGPNTPFTCIGKKDCPLCALGDYAGASNCFNVLHLSGEAEPTVKMLQLGVKAFEAFKAIAVPKGEDKPVFEKDFWTATRSGKDKQSQTNFRPIKLADIEDDWPEVLEYFDIEDLDEIIEESREKCFDATIVQVSTLKQLEEVAKYLMED